MGLSIFKLLCLFMILSNFSLYFGSHAQQLPTKEVEALQAIGRKLQIKSWNVDASSCNSGGIFSEIFVQDNILKNITCDCSDVNGTVCHVISMQLKTYNLSGELPVEFGNLTYLHQIDFARNYIGGSIPAIFSQLPLVNLILMANRLTGPIPEQLGQISTLEQLVLEDNQLSGSLPVSLGRLSRLTRLLLSANNFTGTIPKEYGNLKNLEDFRIDGSSLSGRIPDFIGNWVNMTRLDMQGTSMEGPIPKNISLLEKLQELRISDLTGGRNSSLPEFQAMNNLKVLVLRRCLLTGSIPLRLVKMQSLKNLDLSFNNLTGEIPSLVESDVDFMILNSNSLTGSISNLNNQNNYDFSYNDLTQSTEYSCKSTESLNLISSLSSSPHWCLKKGLPCPGKPKFHSFYINCGGNKMQFRGNNYEDDSTSGGPSHFFSAEKWAYSSSGVYMDRDEAYYLARNSFSLNVSHPIFESARLAPNSLKYFGLCLRNGSYTVKLHFAEIMFSNDQTYKSLGRRIFDVAIQGTVVLKNFNILEEAKGAGKEITMVFDNITVSDSTMEIHLYWLGKGTTEFPEKGVYGPLISAITVEPNYDISTGLSAGAITGIALASFTVLVLTLVVLRMKGYLGGKDLKDSELYGLELQTGYFSLRQIKAGTGNFDPSNKIGEGGFGPVYKGVLLDGSVIAVKQLSSKSKQGNREFVNEIGMISALQHPNLVKLHGCCIEGNQLLLIYEYMENNSLARALFGSVEQRLNLDWATRKKICLGIAKGLAYLHEESRLKIVHRDIKATNVLLDKDLNAKISDFGLAKLDEEENTHISTRIAGTIGYMAPEYAMRGYLTDKADVYSFGIVALEIVSGKSNTNYRPREEFVYLLDWAYVLGEQGNLLDLVDTSLGSHYNEKEAMRMLNLALLCTNASPTLRPSMSSVVSMLEGKIAVQAPIIKCHSMNQDARFKAFELLSQDSQTYATEFSQDSQVVRRSILNEGPWMDSSVSINSKNETDTHSSSTKLLKDLYDINI